MLTPRTYLGDTGPAVREWQAFLLRSGQSPGAIDGIHGPRTEAASVAFERALAAEPDTAADGIRARLVQLARSVVGLTAADRDRWLGLLAGPGDTDGPIREWLAHLPPPSSSCALVVRGLWRTAGLRHPLLLARARPGYPMDDIITISREAGAWVPARHRDGRLPAPGDAVVLESATGGHAFTVLAIEGSELPCRFVSVDGGQEVGGHQAVAQMSRQWRADRGGILDVAYRSRLVSGWCDVTRLRWP